LLQSFLKKVMNQSIEWMYGVPRVCGYGLFWVLKVSWKRIVLVLNFKVFIPNPNTIWIWSEWFLMVYRLYRVYIYRIPIIPDHINHIYHRKDIPRERESTVLSFIYCKHCLLFYCFELESWGHTDCLHFDGWFWVFLLCFHSSDGILGFYPIFQIITIYNQYLTI